MGQDTYYGLIDHIVYPGLQRRHTGTRTGWSGDDLALATRRIGCRSSV